jgi:hypothetical protein
MHARLGTGRKRQRMKNALVRLDRNGDRRARNVAVVVTVLGTLAFLSFVMAGIVGEREKATSAAGTPAPVSHAS